MDHYTYRVTWSEEEGEFVGTCMEFSKLSHFDETQEAALAGIRALVSAGVELLKERAHDVPEPFADRSYSGKFLMRIPSALHRNLTMQAVDEGVSLNQLVLSKLS